MNITTWAWQTVAPLDTVADGCLACICVEVYTSGSRDDYDYVQPGRVDTSCSFSRGSKTWSRFLQESPLDEYIVVCGS